MAVGIAPTDSDEAEKRFPTDAALEKIAAALQRERKGVRPSFSCFSSFFLRY
jgi:hypothetical protein